MQGIAPSFQQGVMVMTFTVILSFLPLHSFVICSIGISTHWTWQNQARVRPQMCSKAVNWLPISLTMSLQAPHERAHSV